MVVEPDKYSYNNFSSKGQRVGQAVIDILKKDQPVYRVEEILEKFGEDYLKDIQNFAGAEKKKYNGAFYIFSLLHKDLGQFGIANVVRHWKISRKTNPLMQPMLKEYPNHTKTLFEVDPKKGEITLLWTVPGCEECRSILKSPELYNSELVTWVKEACNF